MKPVRTKKDFVERYINGEFGNASLSWPTYEEFVASGYSSGPIHFRNKIPGGPTHYNVDPLNTLILARELEFNGTLKNYYISAMAPHDKGLIQGEVSGGFADLYLYYNLQKLPMREAFAVERRFAAGIKARVILQRFMDGNSWEWLNQLLVNYPDHVVEFSTFEIEWGTVPHFNTVFWEVRRY